MSDAFPGVTDALCAHPKALRVEDVPVVATPHSLAGAFPMNAVRCGEGIVPLIGDV